MYISSISWGDIVVTENTVVYLDGSGKTPGAYRTLAAAAAALPEGEP